MADVAKVTHLDLPPLQRTVADLQDRLSRLEAERDITALFTRYGHSVDAGDERAWVDCFTEDGRFSTQGPDPSRPDLDVRGRVALQAFAAGHTRRPGLYHLHAIIESRLEVADGLRTATCSSYMFTMMRWNKFAVDREVPVLRAFGIYRDELVRREDGAWRLRWRHAELFAADRDLPPLAGPPRPS